MATSFFHWPGGVPPTVRPDPSGELTFDQMAEEAKGWILFVTENWTPRESGIPDTDSDHEVRQRRGFVETWASADQSFRDSYQQRAPPVRPNQYPPAALYKTREAFPHSSNFLCLAPLSARHRSNLSKWIKLSILSYRLDGEMGHCLSGEPHQGIHPNPATFPDKSTLHYKDLLPLLILETANFSAMTMTSRGTVLFTDLLSPWFLVNQEDLDTGRIACVEFRPNGDPEGVYRRRAFNMQMVYLGFAEMGKTIWELEDSGTVGGGNKQNTPVDMTLPLIDILQGAKEREEFIFGFDGAPDVWEEDIETYAPGYLQMEAEGNEADYDHARLIHPNDL